LSNHHQKLHSSRLIRNLGLREEVGKAIDQNLSSLLADANYQQASTSSQYNQLSSSIFESCSELPQIPKKRKHAFWFDDTDEQIDELLKKRRAHYQSFLNNKTETNRLAHKRIQKDIREHLRLMENNFWEKNAMRWNSFQQKEILVLSLNH